jgi:GTP-binding protein EngB required for normal cell division
MSVENRVPDRERQVEATHSDVPTLEPRAWLQDYDAIKFELAGLIREGSSAAWQAKQDTLQRDFQALLKRLAEDRFYLTLAGQFSRGKTTLMNAMLGMDRLPTGVVPVTSVITSVSYNARERVVMYFENSNLTHEVPLSELAEWITEKGNPGNRRGIEMAEVQLPAELLRRGAYFVDTPGLGSAVIENTETTNQFLPHIDALVLVTSFEFPLSQDEILFLRRARELHRKSFVVINKMDLCAPGQRDEVIEFIRLRIAAEAGPDEIPIFAVSASEALAAKLERDPERLEKSGLVVFEQALVNYLVASRYRDFLVAMCDRIELLLAYPESFPTKELEARLEGLRARIFGGVHPKNHAGNTMRSLVYAEADGGSLKISPCFICKKMADATFRFLSQFQYDLSHSREQQLLHASKSGFCTLHSREYARLASPQGIASGYPRTLLFVAEKLRSLSPEGRLCHDWRKRLEGLLPDRDKCRACQVVAETERETISKFVREYRDVQPDNNAALPCVCLRHLTAVLDRGPEKELANQMVVRSAAVLERTAEDMERFALRHGGRHMELVTQEELASPETGLNLLVGQPNVRPIGPS